MMAAASVPVANANGDCNTQSTKGKTWTVARSACTAQARIDRYVTGYPTTYLGPKGQYSKVTETVGVNAGNATRTMYGGAWTWWNFF